MEDSIMNQNINTVLEIDASRDKCKISPLIYGNFIEFITDCINKGIWAEMLLNRGFENPDNNGDGISDPWYPVGFNDMFIYRMDENEVFNSKYSQNIEIINHYGGYRGIAQSNLKFFKGECYRGYIWLKASNSEILVEINIKTKAGTVLFNKKYKNPAAKWEKYDFIYQCENDCDDGVFEINMHGEGNIWLDQVSMMPESAVDGVWKEVVRAAKELKPGIIRFPGGCFADCYHWEDGIGPRDKRPTRENLHWKGNEENNFGTDEFIKFCRNIGCEPMICINFGSGTPEEAANWVEYCNGGIDTPYGKLRAENGNPEPYNVKYWEIGNEIFGNWETGHCTVDEFAERYMEFYIAMKEKDSSIEIFACGGDGNSLSQEWNDILLKKTNGMLDYITLHCYAPQIENKPVDNRQLYYGTVGAVCKYETLINDTRMTIKKHAADRNIRIAVTEWNTMYNNSSFREHTVEAAVFNAGMLNMFIRNCDIIHVCNFSDLVNGWQGGCIRSDRGNVYFTPSYYVLKLYSQSGAEYVLESKITCEVYDIDKVGHVEGIKSVPYVDAVACKGNGEIIVFIVNRHLENSTLVNFKITGAKIKNHVFVSEITSDYPYDVNVQNREKVKIRDSIIYSDRITEGLLVSPYSIVRLKIPVMD